MKTIDDDMKTIDDDMKTGWLTASAILVNSFQRPANNSFVVMGERDWNAFAAWAANALQRAKRLVLFDSWQLSQSMPRDRALV